MALPASSPSPALMAANRRLHQLREQLQANKKANWSKHENASVNDSLPWQEPEPHEVSVTAVYIITKLPTHLGWESDAASQTIRAALNQTSTGSCRK